MSTEFLRNYIDIIKEAEQPRVQLDEGLLDSAKASAQNLLKKIAPQQKQRIIDFVSKAIGKPADQITMADVNMGNIRKLIAANQQMAEGWGGAAIGGILGAMAGAGTIPVNNPGGTTVLIAVAATALIFAALGALADDAAAEDPRAQQQAQDQARQQNRDELDDYLGLDK